jgi:hypothetical protein
MRASRYDQAGDGLGQHPVPILFHDVPVGEPVLDDVPEAIERQQAVSPVGQDPQRIDGLLVEVRIAHPRVEVDVALVRVGEAVLVHPLEPFAHFPSQE